MKAALVFMSLCLASGLDIPDREPENPKYAYITMWINKETAPTRTFNHILSKAETVALNTGVPVNTAGGVDLSKGQKVRTQLLEVDSLEGKPKKVELKQEVQKIPLRPRNNNFNGILDIAKNLRDVGAKYPLVVLTNSEELRNETVLAENPNLKLVWLNDADFIDRHCKIGAGHELHFQKLMIWNMTQFDKLIWFDTDVAFANNVDYAFKMDTQNGRRIYGQIDDYHCDGREWSPTSGGICSAMLLVKPSKVHFQGLMQQQKRMQMCWGDQSIISSYFNQGQQQAFQFKRSTINFARCKSQGFMDVVHFSGSPDAKRIGDPEGFKRLGTGQLVNMTEIKLKAKAKADAKGKKKMDLKKKTE